MRNSQLKQRS